MKKRAIIPATVSCLACFLLTAFPAAGQYTAQSAIQTPVRTISAYPASPAAEMHFVDGTISHYPILRISKDLVRVKTGNDQSMRMPLTYVDSIRFQDGCTLHFDNGVFQFDQLGQPARLSNEIGDVLLEGVLQLSKPQAEALMGPEYYRPFRKQARLLKAGEITLFAGTAMVIPYVGKAIPYAFSGDFSPVEVFNDMPPFWKGVTIGGCGALLTGAALALIGNAGCNRIIATYNNGLGVAYAF
jgi:hypothetical protein